jgi:hypothetical protein
MIVGSPSLRGHASTVGHNATPMKDNSTLLEMKGINLAIEFDVSGAHDRLVGCQCDTFSFLNMWQRHFVCLIWITIISSRPHYSVLFNNEFNLIRD